MADLKKASTIKMAASEPLATSKIKAALDSTSKKAVLGERIAEVELVAASSKQLGGNNGKILPGYVRKVLVYKRFGYTKTIDPLGPYIELAKEVDFFEVPVSHSLDRADLQILQKANCIIKDNVVRIPVASLPSVEKVISKL